MAPCRRSVNVTQCSSGYSDLALLRNQRSCFALIEFALKAVEWPFVSRVEMTRQAHRASE